MTNSTLYNSLGLTTQMTLGNGAVSTWGYWGMDTAGGYYGRLWQLKTVKSGQTLMQVQHSWDAAGNLAQRFDVLGSDTENFGYDYLDRLTGVTGSIASFVPTPGTLIGGYMLSAFASGMGLCLTGREHREGRAEGYDVVVAGITFGMGLIPYVGVIPAAVQLVWDKARQGGSFKQ